MREATGADLPRLIEMARQFHLESSDAPVAFDEPGAIGFFTGLMESGCVFITDDGFVCGLVTSMPCLDKSYLVAHECLWWAGKSGPQLLSKFEEWAREKGASRIVISHRHGRTAAFERLYRMRKYEPYEHYYQRSI